MNMQKTTYVSRSSSRCSFVAFHVRLEAVTLGEAFVAKRALVRSLPIVGPHVNRQVGFTSARLPANPASKRLLTRVDPEVVEQIGLSLEGPAAVRAAVRRLPRVDPHVDGQRAFGGEGLAALAAIEGFLLAVRPQVDLQLLAGQKHLAADVTEVRSLSVHVYLLMLSQSPCELETPPADLTAMWSLLRVCHPVAEERPVVAEGFATLATLVHFSPGVSVVSGVCVFSIFISQ